MSNKENEDQKIGRRSFLKWTLAASFMAAGGVGAYYTWRSLSGEVTGEKAATNVGIVAGKNSGAVESARKNLFDMRTLGKTGLKVYPLAMGQCTDPESYHDALEMGINLFETARGYMGGNHEEIIGRVLKKIKRESVIIVTKFDCRLFGNNGLTRSAEQSLRALGTDYIDILMAHGLDAPELLKNETGMKQLSKLKKSGKIRFCGISTHATKPMLEEMMKTEFYDIAMVGFNFSTPEEAIECLINARKAGIGIIGMKSLTFKTKNRKKIIPAALRYALSREFIDTVAVPVMNGDHLDENLESAKKQFTQVDLKLLQGNLVGPFRKYF